MLNDYQPGICYFHDLTLPSYKMAIYYWYLINHYDSHMENGDKTISLVNNFENTIHVYGHLKTLSWVAPIGI